MKSAVKISILRVLLPALLLPASACRRDARPENPDTPPPKTSAGIAPPDTVVTVDGMTGEEIFRRAFWRRPAAEDRIIQAVRHEQRASIGDPATVQTWRWFIQLHPSPELLAALRDPDTFGLLPAPGTPGTTLASPGTPGSSPAPSTASAPRPWSATTETPDWFPSAATLPGPVAATTGFEILQSPSSGLTVLYRASDNMLYATDAGAGFAAPAR